MTTTYHKPECPDCGNECPENLGGDWFECCCGTRYEAAMVPDAPGYSAFPLLTDQPE